MRKSASAFFILLFIVGWAVRALVPAYQAHQRRPDKERRNDSLKVVVDRLYEFAATNNSSFPKSLGELGALTNSFRQRIDFNDYLFRPSARVHSEKIDGTGLSLVKIRSPCATGTSTSFQWKAISQLRFRNRTTAL